MSLSTATASSPNPWLQVLDALEKKVNRLSYDTWLKPTRFSHSQGNKLFVRVPTPEFRLIGEKYADLIQEALDSLGLGFEDVEFVTDEAPADPPMRHDGGFAPQSGVAAHTGARAAGAFRLGRRGATQSEIYLRQLRHRPGQPVCQCGGARGR